MSTPTKSTLGSSRRAKHDGAGMRWALMRNLALLVLLTSGAILGVMVFGAYQSVDGLSRSLLGSTADTSDRKLELFLEPVNRSLAIGRDWGGNGTLDLADRSGMNRLLMPLLLEIPQASGLIHADAAGREYFVSIDTSGDGERLRVRERNPAEWGRRYRVTYWVDASTQLGAEQWEELDYDPHTRPWYRGAVAQMSGPSGTTERGEGDVPERVRPPGFWTEPYTFFTTQQPGITASVAWRDTAGELFVFGVDVLLLDVSRFTTALTAGESGIAFVLDEGDRIIGLPRDQRFEDVESMRSTMLSAAGSSGIESLDTAITEWQAARPARQRCLLIRNRGRAAVGRGPAASARNDAEPARRRGHPGVGFPRTDAQATQTRSFSSVRSRWLWRSRWRCG